MRTKLAIESLLDVLKNEGFKLLLHMRGDLERFLDRPDLLLDPSSEPLRQSQGHAV